MESSVVAETPIALGSKKRNWKRLCMFTVVALSSVYLTFAPAVMPLYSTLIFHPFVYPHGHFDEDSIDGIPEEVGCVRAQMQRQM